MTDTSDTLPCNPFFWLPIHRWRNVFAGAAVLTALLMVAIYLTNAPLENPVATRGIVSLQLAGSPAAAQKIISSWGALELRWALLNLAIDYLYLLSYATTLSLGCVLLAYQKSDVHWRAWLGIGMSWGVVVAALLDALENGFLLALLLGDLHEDWTVLAFWCAVPKFALVLAVLAYLVIEGLGGLAERVAVKRRG